MTKNSTNRRQRAGTGKAARNVQNEQTCARKRKISDEKLIEAAKKSNGIMTLLGQIAGIDRRTAKKYLEEVSEAKEEFESQRESMLDFCESELLRIIQGTIDPGTGKKTEHPRKFEAIQFALSTLGKKRGYSQKIEQEVSGELKNAIPQMNIIIEQ